MNELSKFITKYNISKNDLVLLSELYFKRKKFNNIPFSKDYSSITKEIRMIEKKYKLSFLDSGNIVLLIGKVPQITYDNYDDILNENKTAIIKEKTETIVEENSNNPSNISTHGAIINKTPPKSKSYSGVIVLSVFALIIFFIFKKCGQNPEPNSECYQIYFNGSSNAFKFCPNGVVEVWDQGESAYDRSCLTIGEWRMDGDDIVIENLFNPNCPEASRKNGSYYIPGTEDIDGSKHIWRSSDRNK